MNHHRFICLLSTFRFRSVSLTADEPGSSLTSRTRIKTLAYDTIIANSRFFGNDISGAWSGGRGCVLWNEAPLGP